MSREGVGNGGGVVEVESFEMKMSEMIHTLNRKIFANSKFRESAPYPVGRKICD